MANTVTEASGTLGAATTPEEWAAYVVEHLSNLAVVLQSGVRRIVTARKEIHIPRVLTDGSAVWLAELATITSNAPTGDLITLVPRKVGALSVLGNETVADSDPAALNVVGQAMIRKVALTADDAFFNGTGSGANMPQGLMTSAYSSAISNDDSAGGPDYEGLVNAAGKIRGSGGNPNVCYLSAADHVAIQLEAGADGHPLVQQDTQQGPLTQVAGMTLYTTPSMSAGTALVADSTQILCAVRNDPTVAFDTGSQFGVDGTAVRVIARVDIGINDPKGLCSVTTTSDGASKAAKSDRAAR